MASSRGGHSLFSRPAGLWGARPTGVNCGALSSMAGLVRWRPGRRCSLVVVAQTVEPPEVIPRAVTLVCARPLVAGEAAGPGIWPPMTVMSGGSFGRKEAK